MITLGLSSCKKVVPSIFWKDFMTKYLKEDISEQGLRGGHRAMYWKANKRAFQQGDILKYASENGWKLVDSMSVQTEELSKWIYNNAPIFPLSYTGFSTNPSNNSTYENFPRWITVESKIYMFETKWVTVEPGTDETNYMNGFVLLNNEGSEMSVYHLWGE